MAQLWVAFSIKEVVIPEESFSKERLTWISKRFLLNDKNHPPVTEAYRRA